MRRFLLFTLFLSLTIVAFFIGRLTINRQLLPTQINMNEVALPHPPQSPFESLNVSSESLKQTIIVRRVIDGDTVELESGDRVRLIGIDTPEVGDCFAEQATDSLRLLVEGKSVKLEKDISETDRYGRLLRYIWANELLVNEMLVKEGDAHSSTFPPDVKHQDRFIEAERQAREANRGLWSACRDVKGASISPTEGCIIKGNISSSGEKIYHLPGQRYYEKTQIDESKGEQWFCSEENATAAGWRKSKV